jgi:S-adenosylmethionine/arginine decarboxylase-like enzyme
VIGGATQNNKAKTKKDVKQPNDNQATSSDIICMEGNVNLDICVDGLQYKDAVKFRRDTGVKSDTLVKDAFWGFHIMIDVVFTIKIDKSFRRTLLAKMCELAKKHNVRVVHDHAEIFDGEVSPPGFAVVALLDKSHMSAHCYSNQGKLTFDVFICGSNPDHTHQVARDVLAFLKDHLGSDADYQIHRMPRFPLHRGVTVGHA